MDLLRELGKALLIFGAIFVLAGVALVLGTRLPFRLGRLPERGFPGGPPTARGPGGRFRASRS